MSYLYALEMRIPDYSFAPVKVGFSREPSRRVRGLSNGPFPTVWLGQWPAPNGYADEAAIHSKFKDHRLFGEWFYPCRELQSLIKEKLGNGSVEHRKTTKAAQFETRFRRMFSSQERIRLGLLPDPFSIPPTFAYEFQKDIDAYMDALRLRWPVNGDWVPENQCLKAHELAPLLGISTDEVKARVPAIRLTSHMRRYRLREVRQFLEHNVGFLKSQTC